MYCCFGCLPCCCRQNSIVDAPFGKPDAIVANQMYRVPSIWIIGKMYSIQEGEPKPIKAVRLHPKSEEELVEAFAKKPERWEKLDLTTLNAKKANHLARLQPDFVLLRLREMFKETRDSTAETRFIEDLEQENVYPMILQGVQDELNDTESPAEFLRANSSVSRLIVAFITKGQTPEHREILFDFVEKIPSQILDEEESQVTEERVEKIRRMVIWLLELLPRLIQTLAPLAVKLLVEIYIMIEIKGKTNPEYSNMGALLSFGQFTLRYLNPYIACLRLADISLAGSDSHQSKNAIYISKILQFLDSSLSEECLKIKLPNEGEHFIIPLVLGFQEEYNLIRDKVFA